MMKRLRNKLGSVLFLSLYLITAIVWVITMCYYPFHKGFEKK